MINLYIKYFSLFVFLLLFQVFILNNIQINTFFVPYAYIFFILSLPLNIEKWLLLVLAFITGFFIDIFSDTPGLHTSASLIVAYARPYLVKRLENKEEAETGIIIPTISKMGFQWFILYSSILVFLHHFYFFLIENFRFSEILFILTRSISSTIISLILILLIQYMFFFKKK